MQASGGETMGDPVIVVVIMVVAVVVGAVMLYVYHRGVENGEDRQRERSRSMREREPESIYGRGVSSSEATHELLNVMRSAVILTDGLGNTRYVSPLAARLGVANGGRITSVEVRDMLTQVVKDNEIRDREIELHPDAPSGRITDRRTMFLRVRIGHICSVEHGGDDFEDDVQGAGGAYELYAVFLEDTTDQRRFAQMKRDFVTNVSHELKTPAGAIALLAETVGDAADDPDAVRYFSGRIHTECERLTELVRKLIELQKAQDEQSLSAADVTRVSVPKIVREAVAENEVQAAAKNIELRMFFGGDVTEGSAGEEPTGAVDPDLPVTDDVCVLGDEESLKSAVKNLVENAIHYSPANTCVRVGVGRVNGSVRIRVVDQGIGIPQEAQGRIFERFYRVDPARSRETGGTGLGLSIAKHIVQGAGGTISVWSRPGEGSTFTITLPRAQ